MPDQAYNDVMDKIFEEIMSSVFGTFSIDYATDNPDKSRSNVILHSTIPLFIEYLKSDLNREKLTMLSKQIEDTMKRLD